MSDDSFVQLSGSQRGPLADVEPAGAIDGSERIELTIVTRRRAELPLDDAGVPVRLTRRGLQHSYGADPADLELVAGTAFRLGRRGPGRVRSRRYLPPSARSCPWSRARFRAARSGSRTGTARARCRFPPSSTASWAPCWARTTAPSPGPWPGAPTPPRPGPPTRRLRWRRSTSSRPEPTAPG